MENNLSETAFYVPIENGFHIRWFTPVAEVDLCGHATLATAFVIHNIIGNKDDTVRFISRSGDLFVTKNGDALSMDFPSQPGSPCPTSPWPSARSNIGGKTVAKSSAETLSALIVKRKKAAKSNRFILASLINFFLGLRVWPILALGFGQQPL